LVEACCCLELCCCLPDLGWGPAEADGMVQGVSALRLQKHM
jgi:hypothetical protein